MGDGTAANVRVGVVGGIFRGPLTATLPANHAAAVAANLESTLITGGLAKCGYVSTDGVTQTIDASTSKITAWGGDVVRVVQTEHSVTYKYKVIETNEETLKEYYGEDATAQEVQITGAMLPRLKRVIPVRDGNKRIVIVLPDSQVISRSEIQYYGEDAVGYEVEVEAFPDENGVKAYLYLGDVTFSVPTITDLEAATGDIAGGTLVTITGTGFIGVVWVMFGDLPAMAFNPISSTEILAFSPAVEEAGVVEVRVKAAGGVSDGSDFTYTEEA